MRSNSLLAILRTLAASEAEFVLVGGLAAVLQGAPIQTYDVDIVYARNPKTIARLFDVLSSLDAIFRIQPERKLHPAISHLAGGGHLNLLTRNGPLDLLGTIGNGLHYEDLLSYSSEMYIGESLKIQVLNLEKLIQLKEELGGEKDTAVLPVLRQTLQESKKHRDRPTS
jgi:hypothetical protein